MIINLAGLRPNIIRATIKVICDRVYEVPLGVGGALLALPTIKVHESLQSILGVSKVSLSVYKLLRSL